MNKTIIVVTTHRGMSDDTYEACVAAQPLALLKVKGIGIVEKARNHAFDRALESANMAEAAGAECDSFLFVDDDMVFTPTDAKRLVDASLASDHPRSARYVTESGALAGAPYPTRSDRWGFGLGFMAVPRARLVEASGKLPRLADMRLWCQVGEHPIWGPEKWVGEDLWWCAHFGGVDLDPYISVGHLKTMALYPARVDGGIRLMSTKQKV